MTFCKKYTFGNVKFIVQDIEFGDLIKRILGGEIFYGGDNVLEIKITGDKEAGYCIYNEGVYQKSFKNISNVFNYIINCIEELFIYSLENRVYLMHAASVTIDNAAISLLGTSGAGKTSLSLALVKYGNYMGDEYAYLDTKSGEVWHELHPFQLKTSNKDLLSIFLGSPKIEIKLDNMQDAFYFPIDELKKFIVGKKFLKVLVFPKYDCMQEKTIITKLETNEYPKALLESIMGAEKPAQIFRNIIECISREKIVLVKILFSDVEDAAKELYEYVKGINTYEV